ncbi:MAG TPA: hypothetical protein VFV17_04490 [Usitatibacteraceae bacterium]|nr:hypothetical protein [Usitatibacteraceae bacterium]
MTFTSLLRAALGAVLALAAIPAFSQDASDFKTLAKARKFADIEALGRERLKKNGNDDVAIWYLARYAAGDEKKREEFIPLAEQCVRNLPASARCHHALGTLYGAAAMSAGLVNGIKYATRIKDSFATAVELDPAAFDARRDLNQFYLQAPGLAGGSVRKAVANSEAHARLHAGQGAILRAEVHAYEKEFELAEKLLSGVRPAAGDEDTATALNQAWAGLGFAMLNDKRAAQAVMLFERRLAADMGNALFHFGLGRAHLENGAADLAIAALEKALSIDSKLSAHYRLGIAYQLKGDRSKAMAAFQQFLGYSSSGKAADDARARLEALKKGV